MSKIFQKKLVNVSSMQQTQYHDCFMLLTFTSFFIENFTHKRLTFFKKIVEKMKKNEDFGNFWFKKKN